MQSLARCLLDYDLGLLEVIAELWGLDLDAPSQREAADQLAAGLLEPERVRDVVESLAPEARAALEALNRAGRQPWAAFARAHGELRAMGPARREREAPWRNAPSATEALYYRGLVARAFFDDGTPQEFAFIPDDLRPWLPAAAPPGEPPGRSAAAPPAIVAAQHHAADDAVTLLAYLQVAAVKPDGGTIPARHRTAVGRFLHQPAALDLWLHLLRRLALVAGSPLKPEPADAREFLAAPRVERGRRLADAWRADPEWNDLRRLPGLTFEGAAWRNDPLAARQAILALLAEVPPGEWWSAEAFVAAVKQRAPDFQRPGGDYDSWYIRDAASQTYLRGFEHWDRVDGALVRWIITAPMHWLGLVDLSPDGAAFRLSPSGLALLGRAEWPAAPAGPAGGWRVNADGSLRAPPDADGYDRFQIARVSNWLPAEGGYVYRLAPASLARAAKQGIRVGQVAAFLEKLAGGEMPPSLVGALHRWERSGGEAALKDTVVLRVKSAELMETLRRTPTVKRLLGESLGATVVEVRRDDLDKLRAALAELGLLAD